MDEENSSLEETVPIQSMDAKQLTQIVGALIDQKMSGRIQKLEENQAENSAAIQGIPGLVNKFRAALPGLIQTSVQQNVAAVLQQLMPMLSSQQSAHSAGQTPPVAQPSPQPQGAAPQGESGAGAIPLGLEIQSQPAQGPTPPQQQPQAPPQAKLDQAKASEIVKQLGGLAGGGSPAGAMGMGGGSPFQQMFLQMMMQKMLGGPSEKPANPVETILGMTNTVSQFAEALAGLSSAFDSIRGGGLAQRREEAMISKIEAEAEAAVLRALSRVEEKQRRKAGSTK